MEKLIALRPEIYLTGAEYEQMQRLVVAERLMAGGTIITELAEKALSRFGCHRAAGARASARSPD